MPYIKNERRARLNLNLGDVAGPGELNYKITRLLLEYLDLHGESYQTYNDILGALEGAKLELYRRRVAWYEDQKIKEHGDVY